MIEKPTIRIGLIGEDPNDTAAITNLMKQRFDIGFIYIPLSKNKRGSQIFTSTAVRSYNVEIRSKAPDLIIVIVDADAIASEKEKIKAKENVFSKMRKDLNCNSVILLLNIYELEALILADVSVFNTFYSTEISYPGSVMHKEHPKEFLIAKTNNAKKYHVSHCPELFKLLRFETVRKNCAYFHDFVTDFEQSFGG